jgi:hypothetical protein
MSGDKTDYVASLHVSGNVVADPNLAATDDHSCTTDFHALDLRGRTVCARVQARWPLELFTLVDADLVAAANPAVTKQVHGERARRGSSR